MLPSYLSTLLALDSSVEGENDLDALRRAWNGILVALSEAQGAKSFRDESMKLWLRRLRDLAYDAEDVLDLCNYEIARAEVESAENKVRRPTPPSSPFTVSEIVERLRSFWEKFAELKRKGLGDQLIECGGCDEDRMLDSAARRSPPGGAGPLPEEQFFGRDDEMERLNDMLLSHDASDTANALSVIALVATGGVGKTSLVRRVYDDPAVEEHFDLTGWVSASATGSDLALLAREVARSLTWGGSYDSASLNVVRSSLKGALDEKRFLLVLDDVRAESRVLWDELKEFFTTAGGGSRVLITTREREVADWIGATVFQLSGLPFEHCLSLFRSCAFSGPGEEGEFRADIGREIISRCKGSPMAVRLVASFLRHEDDEKRWSAALNSELWRAEEGSDDIFGPLQLSYFFLPADLKPCFAYCSVFLKDHIIEVEELVRLWMVEGIIEDKQGRTLEGLGMEYVDDLLSRSFFQPEVSFSLVCGGEKTESVKMHGLIREFAQRVSTTRAGTLIMADIAASEVDQCLQFKHVRALDFSKMDSPELPPPVGGDLKLLRYLKLVDSNINRVPDSVFALYNLQVLNLRSTDITELPSSIGNLKQLRHLVLEKTQIKKLPESVCTLHCLRVLNMNSAPIKDLPGSLGSLRELRQCLLGDTEIEALPESICTLHNLELLDLCRSRELEELPVSIGDMKSLRHISLFGTRIDRLPEGLFSLCNLENLDLTYARNIRELPDAISTLKNLQFLSLIAASLEKVPESICLLHSLQVLDLSHTGIRELPDAIGDLKSLQRLHLVNTKIRRLPDSVCQLGDLRILDLGICRELEELPTGFGDLTNLRFLGGSEFTWLPAGIGRLTKLETLARFPVGTENGQAGIAELMDLNELNCGLAITGLCNVLSVDEAKAASLKKKAHLAGVTFDWKAKTPIIFEKQAEEDEVAMHDEALLEALHPSTKISNLEIASFGGFKLPKWVGHLSFTKLASVRLSDCLRCSRLPHFELLPSMTTIAIERMPSLEHIGSGSSEVASHFSRNGSLSVNDCPRLRSVHMPAPRDSDIDRCGSLESVGFSGASMSLFKISDCARLGCIQCLPTSVEKLSIRRCPLLAEWRDHLDEHLKLSHVRKVLLEQDESDEDREATEDREAIEDSYDVYIEEDHDLGVHDEQDAEDGYNVCIEEDHHFEVHGRQDV